MEVVGAHAGDERIWAWDLCNEPFMGAYVHDEGSPLRATEPLSDVLGFHPYWMRQGIGPETHVHTRAGFEAYLDECVALARSVGKELYASETVWGARDDARHVEVMRSTLGQLRARGVGFTVHALHHSGVADLHRDAHGPVGHPEWMHLIDADGSLCPGHEAFNEFAPAPAHPAG